MADSPSKKKKKEEIFKVEDEPEEEPKDEPKKSSVESPEIKKKKREVKGLIKHYLSSIFNEHLGKFRETLTNEDLNNMNLSKLKDLLEEIEYTVDCHESNAFLCDSFTMCISLGKTLLSKNGIKCYGLAHKLMQDEKALSLVKWISLKQKIGLSPNINGG